MSVQLTWSPPRFMIFIIASSLQSLESMLLHTLIHSYNIPCGLLGNVFIMAYLTAGMKMVNKYR